MGVQQRCSHKGCSQWSHTGFWCQECIEQEWPFAAIGDGDHWIVWKGVNTVTGNLTGSQGTFTGALGCPYCPGQLVVPQGNSNWLLSPLGAIKEGYGTHILAALTPARGCQLRPDLVLDCTAAVLPLLTFPRYQLPTSVQAKEWLADVNAHLVRVEVFEQQMRAHLESESLAVQVYRFRVGARVHHLRVQLFDAMRRHLPQRLVDAERLSPWEQLAPHILRLQQLLPAEEQCRWIVHYLAERELEPQRHRAHKELLLRLAEMTDLAFREELERSTHLNAREKEILVLRYGLADGRRWRLKEVAEKYNITRERVRQVEIKALEKLLHSARGRRFLHEVLKRFRGW